MSWPLAQIVPAERRDAEAVWPLAQALATTFTPQRNTFESAWARLLADPSALVLVARSQDCVVGYLLAHLQLTFMANGPVAWIEEVMVEPEHRRTGFGRQLMTGAETWARENDAAYVALATRRAGAFYTALGYEESAVFFRKILRGG